MWFATTTAATACPQAIAVAADGADTLKRLKQGGLEVNFYPAQYAEMAAETVGATLGAHWAGCC
jgi:hypothetical protein